MNESEFLPKPISFKELFNTEWHEEVFIEGGLLSRGDALIIGAESKAGKSTLVQTLIRQLIAGGEFLGFKVVKPLKVLLMQAEIRESRLKQRMIGTFNGKANLASSYTWNTRGLIMLERDIELINGYLKELAPDVLILDPFINFHSLDENNATQMTNLFRKLDMIKSQYALSVIITQHFKKQNQASKGDSLLEMIRGTSALRGWADCTIAIEGRTSHEYRNLEFDIRNSDKPLRRMIKYDPIKKEFDWYDPVIVIANMLSKEMGEEEITTTQVVGLIIKHCGFLVCKNRNKAFDIKEILVNTEILIAREEGKNIFLRFAK